ncbi:polysaccharide pyruvyl transferase family protein [Clostridium sp. MSJ-8]|uniref:polysaccharide pyruvyl transferase family protein n=1 Tax=Clostridium sp. MSJ-8 TaxID=2841510 RepID=UPI001C0E9F30|nr:polysaccharide pyruvyl transferase family protein [Clostridium sp. MSJ-8]MBU5486781.1 polysaccharide pyruvyl transferase family protein [Clostridium sp. MSJ-8]
MKIATMTWIYNGNYGTVLQAYALQKMLNDKGYETNLINYRASTKSKIKNFFKSKNSYSLFIQKAKSVIFKSKSNSSIDYKLRNKRFMDFLNNECSLTKLYSNPEDLKELNDIYDVFICGSDQIWSPNFFNEIFYLSYVDENRKKIAYAPSFGVSSITNKKKNKIKALLERFDYISVREKQGADIVKELTNKNVEVVLDPTLLLSEEQWEKVAISPNIEEPYILCYFLSDNDFYYKTVEKLEEETGYKVISIPVTADSYNTMYDKYPAAGPQEFLGLIKNAALVCTDSFHGSIFSINFKRDFYVFKRFSDDSISSQNSRIYNILNLLQANDRLFEEGKKITREGIKITNYNEIYDKLLAVREKSIKWLIDKL